MLCYARLCIIDDFLLGTAPELRTVYLNFFLICTYNSTLICAQYSSYYINKMYANRNFMGKVSIVAPIPIVLGIVFGLEWIYIDQILLYYWDAHKFLMVLLSIPFYIVSAMIFTTLFACAIVDPGGISRDWVHFSRNTHDIVPGQPHASQVQDAPREGLFSQGTQRRQPRELLQQGPAQHLRADLFLLFNVQTRQAGTFAPLQSLQQMRS